MKKHLLATIAGVLLMGGLAYGQCAFSWSQTQPNTINFTSVAGPNPNTTVYHWNFGDNQVAWTQQTTLNHTYTVPGTYYVCMNVQDSLNMFFCTYCDTITVTGSVICNMFVGIQATSATCASCNDGSASAIVSNGTAPYAYTWSTGSTTASITNLPPGYYQVCVTDANGCTACDSVNVQWANSSSCGITFTPTFLSSGWVSFAASVTGANSNSSVTWNFGDQTSGYGYNVWHQYSQSGAYVVCATVTDSTSQCTATWCDTVFMNVVPPPCDANFFVQMDSLNPNQAQIYNLSTGSPTMSYQWYWGDNSPVDTGAYPSHVYQNTGSYNICLIVVDQATACTDTMCQLLWVPRLTQQAASAPFYVNVIPPIPTGTAAPLTATGWTLYPNPTNGELRIDGYNSANAQYMITDLSGRTVQTGTVTTNSIDVTQLSSGVFFFTLVKENGAPESKRFVRE